VVAAIFTLSNLAADKKIYVDKLLTHDDLTKTLVKIIQEGTNILKREACYVFGHAALHATVELVSHIFKEEEIVKLISIFLCDATEK
jgi:hypothetical protein